MENDEFTVKYTVNGVGSIVKGSTIYFTETLVEILNAKEDLEVALKVHIEALRDCSHAQDHIIELQKEKIESMKEMGWKV